MKIDVPDLSDNEIVLVEGKKHVPIKVYEKLKEWYCEELKRRDGLVDQLRKENLTILQSALKQSDRNHQLEEQLVEAKKLLKA